MFIIIKKSRLILSLILILSAVLLCLGFKVSENAFSNAEIKTILEKMFLTRNKAILTQDLEAIDTIYHKESKLAVWAYEHEEKKMKYLHNWSEKQGVVFIDIVPTIVIRRAKGNDDSYSVNLICSTEYKYIYEGLEENQSKENSFRIGTYHNISLKKINDQWLITKEWYTDPFADSLNLENLKVESIKEYILSQTERDFSTLPQRRLDAVKYADQYSGAANEEKYGFVYNKKYGDFNPQGGDCANFASQILHEGGKFKKTSSWNFDRGNGTRSWLNAQGFKDFWVGSGRASVVAYGSYEKVYKASYKLRPGDFVAYEKGGKVTHISMVTGADSKGYTLVNCHNSDRNRVPWDLGWSNKNIKFWLISVHF